MTYNIEEFKNWLTNKRKLQVFGESRLDYLNNQGESYWLQANNHKSLDAYFGTNDLYRVQKDIFTKWIKEVDERDQTLSEFKSWLRINPEKGDPNALAWIKLIN